MWAILSLEGLQLCVLTSLHHRMPCLLRSSMLIWQLGLLSVLATHAPMLRGTARLIRSLVLRWVGMPLLVLVLEVSVL